MYIKFFWGCIHFVINNLKDLRFSWVVIFKTIVRRIFTILCFSAHVCSVTQSWPTLCSPMDSSVPGSSVQGIFQARILEWVAISYSISYPWSRDQTESFVSPALAGAFFTTVPPGKLLFSFCWLHLMNEKIITIIFLIILCLSLFPNLFIFITFILNLPALNCVFDPRYK